MVKISSNKIISVSGSCILFLIILSPLTIATPSNVKIALTVDVEYDRGVIFDNPAIYGAKFRTQLDPSWTTSRDLNDEISYYYEFDTDPPDISCSVFPEEVAQAVYVDTFPCPANSIGGSYWVSTAKYWYSESSYYRHNVYRESDGGLAHYLKDTDYQKCEWVTCEELTSRMRYPQYWERLVNFGNGKSYVLSKKSYAYTTNASGTSIRGYAPLTLFGMPENVLTHPRWDQNDRNVVYNAVSWQDTGTTMSHVDLAVFDSGVQSDFSWLNSYTSSEGPTIDYDMLDIDTQLTPSNGLLSTYYDAMIIAGYNTIEPTFDQKNAIYYALSYGHPVVLMGTTGIQMGKKSAVVDSELSAIWMRFSLPAPTVYNQYAIQYGTNLSKSIPTKGAVSGAHLGLDEGLKPILDKSSSKGIPLTLFVTGDAANYLKTTTNPNANAAYNDIKDKINTGEVALGLHTMYHGSMYLLWLEGRKYGSYTKLYSAITDGYNAANTAFESPPNFFRGPKLASPYNRYGTTDATTLVQFLIDSGKTFYVDSTEQSPVSNSSWALQESYKRPLSFNYEPRDIVYSGKKVIEVPAHNAIAIGYGPDGDTSDIAPIKKLINSNTDPELTLVLYVHPWELKYWRTYEDTSYYFDDPMDDLLVQDYRVDKFNDFVDKLYNLKSEYASQGTTIEFINFNEFLSEFPPSTPTGSYVKDYGREYITLDWDDNKPWGDVYQYKVYRDSSLIASPTASQYNDTGLSPTTNYCYKVTAVNSEGDSDYSSEVCQTTNGPPYNTQEGTNVYVDLSSENSVTFSEVTNTGDTTDDIASSNPNPLPSGVSEVGDFYDISTTAVYVQNNNIVSLSYSEAGVTNEDNLKIFHWTGSSWEDSTSSQDIGNNIISGIVASLSPFVVVEKLDTTPPTVGVSGAPASWQNTNATATTTCTDNSGGAGCDSTTYKLKTYTYDPTCSTTYGDYTLTSPQTISSHQWVCGAAKDNAGNTNFSSPGEFKVDKVSPITTDDAPPDWQNVDVIVTLTPTDTGGSSVAETLYCVDQTNACSPVTSGSTVLVSTEGTNYVRYYSTDNAGNSESVKFATVMIDKTLPAITPSSPPDNSWTNDTTPAFQFTATDNLDTSMSCELFVDGTGHGTTSAPNNTLATITANASLSDGARLWWVNCTDDGPNTGQSAVRTLNIDTILPQMTLASPANTTYATATIDLNVFASENIDTWIYNLNSAENTTFTPNTTITGKEGLNNIVVYANDTAGNMDSLTVYFSIDTTLTSYNQADIYATMFNRNLDRGDTMSSRIYVENSGQGAIDDILRISITDPYGEKVYKDLKPIYIEPDEMESFKISWTVPSDAPEGLYKLRVEFDDWDIDALPRVRWFNVGTATTNASQITITSPPNETTTDTTPDLNFTISETANITYSWNGEGNISGCRNCDSYNATYGESIPDADTSLLMHFNENDGLTAYDDSSYENDGALANAVYTTGKFGPALDFDGSGGYVEVQDSASLNFDRDDSFTMMGWIKIPAAPLLETKFVINTAAGSGEDYEGYHCFIRKKNGMLKCMLHTNSSSGTFGVDSAVPVNDSVWHHFAFVRNVSADNGYLYVDGVLKDSAGDNTNPYDDPANTQNLFIGARDSGSKFLDGTMDELSIIRRALSEAELQELYNKTLSVGQHNVTVWATDVEGNQDSTTRQFNVD